MIDVMMNSRDLVATEFGDIALVQSNNNDILQSVNNNLLTVKGENIFHPDVGNDVFNRRLKLSDTHIEIIKNDCKNAILFDNRVSDVKSIIIDDIGSGIYDVTYVIVTSSGDILDSRISLDIF